MRDSANAADADPAVADHVLLDDKALFAGIALDDARRAIAKLGVDVAIPQVKRLEDVAVGIDDVVLVAHNPVPPNETQLIDE